MTRSSPRKTAVLFQSFTWDDRIAKRYTKLRAQLPEDHDAYCLYDETVSGPPQVKPEGYHGFTQNDLRSMNMGFKRPVESNDLPMMLFSRRHPEYDRYWMMDYDVALATNWHTFFDHFSRVDADMLATYVRTYGDDPSWDLWFRNADRFSRDEAVICFYPIVRFSKRALDHLWDVYEKEGSGFMELHGPTHLKKAGMSIRDINDFGKAWYSRRTFRWRPMFLEPLLHPGKLHHPVKARSIGEWWKDQKQHAAANRKRGMWP